MYEVGAHLVIASRNGGEAEGKVIGGNPPENYVRVRLLSDDPYGLGRFGDVVDVYEPQVIREREPGEVRTYQVFAMVAGKITDEMVTCRQGAADRFFMEVMGKYEGREDASVVMKDLTGNQVVRSVSLVV